MSLYLRRVDDTDPILRDLPASRGIKQKLIFEHRHQAANAAAGPTELDAPDSILNGTATAVIVKVKSADAADTDKTVIVMGINEAGKYEEETIITDDTNGTTAVSGVTKWKRLIHARMPATCAGAVVIRNAADNATHLTIAIGALDSNGQKLWVPSGWDAVLAHVKLTHVTNAGALARGTIIVATGAGFDNPGEVRFAAVVALPVDQIPIVHWKGKGKADCSITLAQTQIAGDETYYLRLFTVMEAAL